MDKSDLKMLNAEKNACTIDVILSNESPVKYESSVKIDKINVEDKRHDQIYSKEKDLKNARRVIEDQLNVKSQPQAYNNVVFENKKLTIDAGTDEMVSVYVTLTNDEVKNIDEVEVNEVDQSEKMIYEVNKNGNNMMVDRSEDKFPKSHNRSYGFFCIYR